MVCVLSVNIHIYLTLISWVNVDRYVYRNTIRENRQLNIANFIILVKLCHNIGYIINKKGIYILIALILFIFIPSVGKICVVCTWSC